MKNWLRISCVMLIFFLLNGAKVAHASEDVLQQVLAEYALTGTELTQFEHAEQRAQFARKIPNEKAIRKQYLALLLKGELGWDVSFQTFKQYASIPEPTDAVASSLRSVAQQPQAGDFIITNGTQDGLGITGHAGIFLADGTILTIAGTGEKPATLTVAQWAEKYMKYMGTWSKIYRPAPQYKPDLAEQWAVKNYKGKNYKYRISTQIFLKDPTYCSKIPWQAYWYASSASQVGGMRKPWLVSPYELPNYFQVAPTHIATWKAKK